MAKILFKNGRVWDGEKFFFADILTENRKIAKIEKNINDEADFYFDATNKIVSAGLIDIHTHFKGISSEEFSVSADLSTIPFGVTTAVDASGVKGDRALLDIFSVKNKVFVCPCIKNNHCFFDGTQKALERFGDKAIGLKVYFDVLVSQVSDITPLKECVDYAREHNLIIMVHSSNPPTTMAELLDALRPGDILTHAYHGGKNNVSDDDFKALKQAKERGVIIDAGLAGHVHTDFKVFHNAIKNGAAPNVISSDITSFSAYKRGGKYGLPMCMSIAQTLGMSEQDVFKAVTVNAAKAVGLQSGYLKVGEAADICVLEYSDEGFDLTDKQENNIKNDNSLRNILTVLNGNIVYRR